MASPRKTRKPKTSVAVVMKIVAEVAGSLPSFFMMRGMRVPKTAATRRLATMARLRIIAILRSRFMMMTTRATRTALIRPFTNAATISRRRVGRQVLRLICFKVMPRTMTARVWVAALPPMPAMMGM